MHKCTLAKAKKVLVAANHSVEAQFLCSFELRLIPMEKLHFSVQELDLAIKSQDDSYAAYKSLIMKKRTLSLTVSKANQCR